MFLEYWSYILQDTLFQGSFRHLISEILSNEIVLTMLGLVFAPMLILAVLRAIHG